MYARVNHRHVTAWWFIEVLNRCEVVMSRGKSKPANGKPKSSSGQWTQFVNVSIAHVPWERVVEAFPVGKDLFERFNHWLGEGYRLAFGYDVKTDCISVAVTCKDDNSPNHGKTMTSFAPSWIEALQAALYKHYVLLDEVWEPDGDTDTFPRYG